MKKKSRTTKIVLIVILLAIISCGFFVISKLKVSNKQKEEIEAPKVIIEEPVAEDDYEELIKLYKTNKAINDDFVGQLFFDSKLIDLPVVQGETNDTYMRTDWVTMKYDIGGSVFLDSSNKIETDQNLIIYGHNFDATSDPSLSKMFSSLRLLKEKENYEKNKMVNLFLGDRLLKYQVIGVYRVKIETDGDIQYIADGEPIYVIRNYTNDEFDEYIEKVKQRQYYDTNFFVTSYDRLLTLQTCIEGSNDKLIVLSKLIEEIKINNK